METKFYLKWYEDDCLESVEYETYEEALDGWLALQSRGLQGFIQKPSY